ncbi:MULTISPECIES: AbrB family transcriptional regulator [Bacillus]|uniref:AbrB family transcriptional regulator n=1 Tax=Bacillus TaxID=1386 RepID=UPI00159711EC|nr:MULTISPECIES: AbrB family transcriptional regulator [Bacillus]
MKLNNLLRLIETMAIGVIGGYIFFLLNLPLPWVLGALSFILVWQGVTKREVYWPNILKNSGFMILGIYFGLYFTMDTFYTIGPYIFPYLLSTIVLIACSIAVAIYVTKWIQVDKVTSVFGSIPGGLSEMVIASEALNAKTSYVVIFQTVRLMTVLFTVPAFIMYFFSVQQTSTAALTNQAGTSSPYTYFLYLIPVIVGVLVRDRLPAGIVVGPLAVVAFLNIGVVEMASIPSILLICAQVSVGVGLGKNISFEDLKLGGKYSFVYFGVSLLLILISFALGGLLAYFTSLNLATAILSIAPGGLIEMVLTASFVGGDPAVVSALQLIRILIIILFVPTVLKWYFRKEVIRRVA